MGLLGNVVADGGGGGEGKEHFSQNTCKEEASHRVACCSRGGQSSLSLNSCLSLAWVPDFLPIFS